MFDPKEKFIAGEDKLFVMAEWRTFSDGTLYHNIYGYDLICKLFINNKRVTSCNVKLCGPFLGPYAVYNSKWSLQPYSHDYIILSQLCHKICTKVMTTYDYEYFLKVEQDPINTDRFNIISTKRVYNVPHYSDNKFYGHVSQWYQGGTGNVLFASPYCIMRLVKDSVCPKSSRNTYDKLCQVDGMTVL